MDDTNETVPPVETAAQDEADHELAEQLVDRARTEGAWISSTPAGY